MENILAKINKASLKFLEPMNVKQVTAVIVEEASNLVKADWCLLYLAKRNQLQEVSVCPVGIKDVFKPRRNGFTYRAYKEKKASIVVEKEIQKIHPELIERYKSAMCIPLSYQKKSVGTLLLFAKKQKHFSKKDLDALKIFGSYASLAIRKALLLNDLNKSLETRDMFISLAAHEFRTPLTTIQGYAQLLDKKLSQTKSQEEIWTKRLSFETSRMKYLVNELLEVDNIKKGNFVYVWSECSLSTIIDKGIVEFKIMYPERLIAFQNQVKGSDVVVGDREKLHHAFFNVFDNAAKFSDKKKEIKVVLFKKNGRLYFSVQDFGRGISEKDINRIFEGFRRKESDVAYGMGVGLFLTKNIVKMHKGEIKINSFPQKGTTVEINFPKAKV